MQGQAEHVADAGAVPGRDRAAAACLLVSLAAAAVLVPYLAAAAAAAWVDGAWAGRVAADSPGQVRVVAAAAVLAVAVTGLWPLTARWPSRRGWRRARLLVWWLVAVGYSAALAWLAVAWLDGHVVRAL